MPPISSAAQTAQFPRAREKTFALAPQPNENVPATSGFTYLHYVDYDPDRQQSAETAIEYGDTDNSVDPTQVDFGDITVSGPLQTRLCLNEIGYHLAHLFGAPVTTSATGNRFQHVFTSGKSTLPYGTIRDTESQTTRVTRDVVYNGLKLAVARGGGVQVCDFDFVSKEIDPAPASALASANVSAGPSRLFVQKNGFRALLDDVQIGRLLSFNWSYGADIQPDRYVEDSDNVSAFYVGDPSLAIGFEVRHVSEVQRAALGGLGVETALKLIGDGPNGTSITIEAPRVKAPIVMPKKDDKLQKLMYDGVATRVTGDSPAPMTTITLINTVESY